MNNVPRGEQHKNSKYTDSEVAEIRRLNNSGVGYKSLSKMFEMPEGTVRDICKGITRK